MFKDNKKNWKDVKWNHCTVFFVNFEHISWIVLVSYGRLWTLKCQLDLLNIRSYSFNKNELKGVPAIEMYSLKIAVPKLSKYKERLRIILAKFLVFIVLY